MSTIIDRPAAITATPRPRTSVGTANADCLAGAHLLVADAEPRLMDRLLATAAAAGAWRLETGSTMRGFGFAVRTTQQDKAGHIADFGGAYVTSTDKQHSIRSGPPTSRP